MERSKIGCSRVRLDKMGSIKDIFEFLVDFYYVMIPLLPIVVYFGLPWLCIWLAFRLIEIGSLYIYKEKFCIFIGCIIAGIALGLFGILHAVAIFHNLIFPFFVNPK